MLKMIKKYLLCAIVVIMIPSPVLASGIVGNLPEVGSENPLVSEWTNTEVSLSKRVHAFLSDFGDENLGGALAFETQESGSFADKEDHFFEHFEDVKPVLQAYSGTILFLKLLFDHNKANEYAKINKTDFNIRLINNWFVDFNPTMKRETLNAKLGLVAREPELIEQLHNAVVFHDSSELASAQKTIDRKVKEIKGLEEKLNGLSEKNPHLNLSNPQVGLILTDIDDLDRAIKDLSTAKASVENQLKEARTWEAAVKKLENSYRMLLPRFETLVKQFDDALDGYTGDVRRDDIIIVDPLTYDDIDAMTSAQSTNNQAFTDLSMRLRSLKEDKARRLADISVDIVEFEETVTGDNPDTDAGNDTI